MIYNIVIYFVLWGIAIASLFSKKVRKMWKGEREAFKLLKQKVDPDAKYIWFHAASLGEFEQGRPLMERIRKEHPQYKILLTFFSPSGYEVRKNYEGADIICYMPIDTRLNALQETLALLILHEESGEAPQHPGIALAIPLEEDLILTEDTAHAIGRNVAILEDMQEVRPKLILDEESHHRANQAQESNRIESSVYRHITDDVSPLIVLAHLIA